MKLLHAIKILQILCFLFGPIALPEAMSSENTGFNQLKKYPSLQQAVEFFFIQYQPADYQNEYFYQFRFARKPSGWYVFSEVLKDDKISEESEILLWSPEKGFIGKDNTISSEREINSPGLMSKVLTNMNRYNFTIYPFYGYKGWEKDVIRKYKEVDIESLSQNEVYGIARAYSSSASNILWSHELFSDPTIVKGGNARKRDIKKFLKYSDKSIEYLGFLDSDYRTLVGLSDLKYANEIVARWYELKLFNFDKEAAKFIKNYDNIFDPFWKESSNLILEYLEQDAILFSLGDADTYPHLFNQEVNKVRRDVLIINLSLLNDPVYFWQLSTGLLDAKPLHSDFSREEWLKLKDRVFVAQNATSIPDLSFMENQSQIISQLESEDNNIWINFGYMNIPFLNKNGLGDSLKILNATKRQIEKNQYILQTILYYHFQDRPIYFTKKMNEEISSMFNPETLLDEGFVVKLDEDAKKYDYTGYTFYDKEKTSNIIKNKSITFPDKKYFARSRFYNLVLEMESTLIISEYKNSDEIDNIKRIMSFLESYPPQEAGISIPYFNMILSLYFIEGKKDIAEMFLRAFLVELEFQIRATELMDDDPLDLNYLKYLEFIIDSIYRSEIEPSIPDFFEKLQSYERSIKNKLRQMPELIIN